MTRLMEEAIAQVSKLPDADQDAFATWLIEEIKAEQQWDKAFASSADALSLLADEALADLRSGKTEILDVDSL